MQLRIEHPQKWMKQEHIMISQDYQDFEFTLH
jgi:hypothetical protein